MSVCRVMAASCASRRRRSGIVAERSRADVGRVRDAVPLCGLDALSVSESDLADE